MDFPPPWAQLSSLAPLLPPAQCVVTCVSITFSLSTGASQNTGFMVPCVRHCTKCFSVSSPSNTTLLARNPSPFSQKGNQGTEQSDDLHKAVCLLGLSGFHPVLPVSCQRSSSSQPSSVQEALNSFFFLLISLDLSTPRPPDK